MRILHVITGMQKASGVTTFVENVVREQRALGHDVSVVTDAVPGLNGSFDVVHIHGLWSPLLHRASRFAAREGVPVIWSTHGMTAPWSMRHKWWKKIFAWHLYQKPDLKAARLIHCTTELEEKWNRDLGFTRTFVAPLGTPLPDNSAASGTTRDAKTLLFVGRLYPVKALDNLIRAFVLARGAEAGWKLRIVGPDQAGHLAELRALCEGLGAVGVEFAGPKFDAELNAEYGRCSALALVSHTENFGATVVDALAHGKPVVTSTRTPWKVVADRDCGWWVDNSPDVLAGALKELFATTPDELARRGANGRRLVEERYTWRAVAESIDRAYFSASCPNP